MLAPLDDPVRESWGNLQAAQSVRLQVGLRTDDMVVEALFAQRNAKGRHYGPQRYQPSRLSNSSSQMSKQKADSFRSHLTMLNAGGFDPAKRPSARSKISQPLLRRRKHG